jgi:hypothetical protein
VVQKVIVAQPVKNFPPFMEPKSSLDVILPLTPWTEWSVLFRKMAIFWVLAPRNFYQTTRRYNPEDSHLRTLRRENLKFFFYSGLPTQICMHSLCKFSALLLLLLCKLKIFSESCSQTPPISVLLINWESKFHTNIA